MNICNTDNVNKLIYFKMDMNINISYQKTYIR